ncbi:MAG: 3-deoxy-manno-octulosonate cytidylyltransferase [Saprospiraceae bacterium]
MQCIGIIPARFASSRFPGKPLIDLGGKYMIQRVYEQCLKSQYLDQVIVATDDERIYDAVQSFGGLAQMTKADHQSGTDRIAEVASTYLGEDIIINIQGDEPFIEPELIDALIEPLKLNKAQIATAAVKIKSTTAVFDPNVVKVVFNHSKSALYFSRSPIPYQRDRKPEDWLSNGHYFKHIGIYAFKQASLMEVSNAEVSILEQQESLEQLRWLDIGKRIFVHLTDHESIGIDSPKDLEKIKHLL